MVIEIISNVMGYWCFNGEAFPRFDFIQYGRHALSYVLVQVTVNVPLIWVKLLRAINRKPDLYSYSCLCECSLTVACWTSDCKVAGLTAGHVTELVGGMA